MKNKNILTHFRLFLIVVALSALASSLMMVTLPNYLKSVYHITSIQRGFIEFPRELPGVLAMFVVAGLVGYSNITISIIAQVLSVIGIATLGFFRPEYNVMLLFIFINSMGHPLSMPINDSLSISLSDNQGAGKRMGQYKGVQTAFAMVASIIVLLGFKSNLFSFDKEWIGVFLLAAVVGIISIILTLVLYKRVHAVKIDSKKMRFIYRREYNFYYALAILYGLQKQIMLVYSPWVIISYFNKGADTLAMLTIIGSFIGMFFIPKLGLWLDKFGIKKLLYLDAWSFVGVFFAFGLTITAIELNIFKSEIIPIIIVYTIYILDKMSNQMSMIRTLYLKQIAITPSEVTPTLSLGLSLDHIISITGAVISGFVWSYFGAQYIFFTLAIISLANVYIAHKVDTH